MLKSKDKRPDIKGIISKMGIVFVLIALIILWSDLSQPLSTVNNLLLTIKQVSLYSILCMGITIVLVTGGIDLPIGSIVALLVVFAARYCSGDHLNMPLYIPIIITVLVGIACGVISELEVAYAEIPPFIVTMCMMLAARGAAYVYTSAEATFNLDERFVNISNDPLGRTHSVDRIIDNYGISYIAFYLAGAMIIRVLIFHFTTYGRRIYALGGNKSTARYSDINTQLIGCPAYAINGLYARICGFLVVGRISSGSTNFASGYEMIVISAAVIGGVSLPGGVGIMYRVIASVLIVGVTSNGVDILGINTYFQQILQTVIIFVTVYTNVYVNGKKK